MTNTERRIGATSRPAWQRVVTVVIVIWLGAQFVAGWKFANGTTYPIVGSAMFNSPPIRGSADFLVPRVFWITASGERVEIDQHTFGLEPFEWRRWVKRNLEDVADERAADGTVDLAAVYAGDADEEIVALELWRIPALTDDFERGRLIRSVEL